MPPSKSKSEAAPTPAAPTAAPPKYDVASPAFPLARTSRGVADRLSNITPRGLFREQYEMIESILKYETWELTIAHYSEEVLRGIVGAVSTLRPGVRQTPPDGRPTAEAYIRAIWAALLAHGTAPTEIKPARVCREQLLADVMRALPGSTAKATSAVLACMCVGLRYAAGAPVTELAEVTARQEYCAHCDSNTTTYSLTALLMSPAEMDALMHPPSFE